MCHDLSSIVCRPVNGDRPRVIRHDSTNSHERLIALHGLREGIGEQINEPAFARLEYRPTQGSWANPTLTVDEERRPSWLDDELMNYLQYEHAEHLRKITIAENRPAVVGGTWRIRGNVKIGRAERCRFLIGEDASLQIEDTVTGNIEFGTIHGSVSLAGLYGVATVDKVVGSLTVEDMRACCGLQVHSVDITGSIHVRQLSGYLHIINLHGLSAVATLCGSGQVAVKHLAADATLSFSAVHGHAVVESAIGTVRVGHMYDPGMVVVRAASKHHRGNRVPVMYLGANAQRQSIDHGALIATASVATLMPCGN